LYVLIQPTIQPIAQFVGCISMVLTKSVKGFQCLNDKHWGNKATIGQLTQDFSTIQENVLKNHPNDWKLPQDFKDKSVLDPKPNLNNKIKDTIGYGIDQLDPSMDNAKFEVLYCEKCNQVIYKHYFDNVLEENRQFEHDLIPENCTCGECHWLFDGKTSQNNHTTFINHAVNPTQIIDVLTQPQLSDILKDIIPFSDLVRDRVYRNKIALKQWEIEKFNTVRYLMEKYKLEHQYIEDWVNSDQELRDKIYSELNMSKELDKNLTPFVKQRFDDYHLEIDGKRCYLLGKRKDNNQYVAKEVFNRFSPKYVNDLRKHLKPLNDFDDVTINWSHKGEKRQTSIDLTKSVFLTLTYDPEKVPTKEIAWKNINKDWNRFYTHLSKILGERIPFFKVPESQQNGYPHLHVIFFGVDWLLWNGTNEDYKRLQKRIDKSQEQSLINIWKKGYPYVNKTKKGKQVRQPLTYALKQLEKTTGERKPHDKGYLTQAMLWFFNIHTYDMSTCLSQWLDEMDKDFIDNDKEIQYYDNIDWLGLLTVYDKSKKVITTEDLLKYLNSDDIG